MTEPTVLAEPTALAVSKEGPLDSSRWWVLGVVGLAQLMVVLDATIVTIALPSSPARLGVF